MKLLQLTLAGFAVLALSACGDSENAAVPSDNPIKVAKKAKGFEGAEFAPTPAEMNYHAGWALLVTLYEHIDEPCNERMNPARIKEECKPVLDAASSKSTFEPVACRKGDERSHQWDHLSAPVSCDGRVNTPKVETDALVVFHKVAGKWRARLDDYSREGLVVR